MENKKLPNSTSVIVLGVLSVMTCCLWGIIGLTLAIVALYLSKKDSKLYFESPELYTNFQTLWVGKAIAIFGLIINIASLIFYSYLISLGEEGLKDFQRNLETKIKYQQEQAK
jgi:membrane glycosyltransferase